MNKTIQQLIDLGAVFTVPATVNPSRAKSNGRMWDGNATLRLDDMEFVFQLWHHGSEKETLESLIDQFSLKGVRVGTQYYDCYWHTITAADGIWLHKKGWFRDEILRAHPLIRRIGNHNISMSVYTSEELKELRKLGFKNIVVFDRRLYTIKLFHTSTVDGEELFGTFVGKFDSHATMQKSAQTLIACLKGIHSGTWDYTWDTKAIKPPIKYSV